MTGLLNVLVVDRLGLPVIAKAPVAWKEVLTGYTGGVEATVWGIVCPDAVFQVHSF
jgi:hypothetical protein